jgi:hypothetical protein
VFLEAKISRKKQTALNTLPAGMHPYGMPQKQMGICFYRAIHSYGMSKSDNLKCTHLNPNFAFPRKIANFAAS